MHSRAISFGPFSLYPQQRRLERAGQPVELGGKAFELLAFLVSRAGKVVSKRELMANVWGEVVVGDGSLRFQIGTLRNVLDEGRNGSYIENVVGRGYCFVGAVDQDETPVREAPAAAVAGDLGKLPAPLARVVGREEAIAEVCALLARTRFVTIVGSGGMGKMTVAVAAGHALLILD